MQRVKRRRRRAAGRRVVASSAAQTTWRQDGRSNRRRRHRAAPTAPRRRPLPSYSACMAPTARATGSPSGAPSCEHGPDAAGPRARGRGGRHRHPRRRQLLDPRPRQGRPGRPQRRRQDEPAEGARRRRRPLRRRRAPQRRPRLPARRTRASTASTTPPPAVRHILSGRGFDEAMVRIEKLRLQMEEDPSERAVSRFTRAEEQFRLDGGYAAESEVRRIAAGLGLEADRLDLPDRRRCPGGQKRRVEIARILFAGSDVLLLDEPTNHLDSDAKDWLLGFMRAYRGALLVISHDLDLLDEAITRVLHLDRRDETGVGDDRGVQGHLLASTSSPASQGRDPPGQAGPAPGQGDRPPPDARRPLRRQGHQGVDGPQHREAHRPPRGQQGRAPRAPAARCTCASRRRRRRAGSCSRATGLAVRYGDLEVFDDVDFVVERGERLLIMGLNGAGKTSLLRVLAGDRPADEGDVTPRPQRRRRLLRPGARGHPPRPHDPRAPARAGARSPPRPTCAPSSAPWASPATRSTRTPARSRAARRRSWRSASSSPAATTCCCSTSPPTTSTPARAQAVAEGLRGWPGSIVLVSHDAAFVRDLAARPGPAHARGHPRPLGRRLPRARRAGVAVAATRQRPGRSPGAARHRRSGQPTPTRIFIEVPLHRQHADAGVRVGHVHPDERDGRVLVGAAVVEHRLGALAPDVARLAVHVERERLGSVRPRTGRRTPGSGSATARRSRL